MEAQHCLFQCWQDSSLLQPLCSARRHISRPRWEEKQHEAQRSNANRSRGIWQRRAESPWAKRREKEGKIRLMSIWMKTLWGGKKQCISVLALFPLHRQKWSRNDGFYTVHDEIQKRNRKEIQRQSSESSHSRAARPVIFKLWSIVTCTARLCLPCDLVPAVLLDKAFQQISIKSYFQRLKTKTTTKNQKPHLKNLLCTKPCCDILHSGQLLQQLLNEHIWAL